MQTEKKITINFTFLTDENGINANFKFNAEAGNKFEDIFQCLEFAKECINQKLIECTEKMLIEIENN